MKRVFQTIIILLGVLWGTPERIAAQDITIVQIDGDSTKYDREQIFYVPIGFRAEELSEFLRITDILADSVNTVEPAKTLRKSLRSYTVMAPSKDSGVSVPDSGIVRDTFLQGFMENGYPHISMDSQSRIYQILRAFPVSYDSTRDQIMLIFNADGGSLNYWGKNISAECITSVKVQTPWATWIDPYGVLHESFGHAIGRLWDTSLGTNDPKVLPSYFKKEPPNLTLVGDPAKVKWKAWLGPGEVPIPTPNDNRYYGKTGMYGGGSFFGENSGVYRSYLVSLMGGWSGRSSNGKVTEQGWFRRFAPVEAEAIYLNLTEKIGLMDDWYPNKSSEITLNSEISFGIITVRHTLSAQWFLDQALINGGDIPLKLNPRKMESGTHELKLAVVDTTHFVRSDPYGFLNTEIVWKLNVPFGTGLPPGPKGADFDGDGWVGLDDFFLFASNFGTKREDSRYDAKYDLDKNGEVGFTDFFIFADSFNKRAAKR